MHLQIEVKPWDSEFFNLKIAEVRKQCLSLEEFAMVRNLAIKEKFDLLYLVLEEENRMLEKLGSRLADTKITYLAEVYNDVLVAPEIVEYPSDKDYRKLVDLAFESGVYSRFKTDPQFGNNEFEKLYTEWIRKSVTHELADVVLVYKRERDILGLATVKLNEDQASIGLIAVSGGYRGQNIGKKLIDATKHFAFTNQCSQIVVPTQIKNVGACKFYEKNGFKMLSSEFIYHLWLKNKK